MVIVQPGLEEIAAAEIKALGYSDLKRIKGGLFLKGHLSTVIKLNFACRTISRVLIDLAEFEARSFSQLAKQFWQINWQDFINEQNVCIHVSSYQSQLYHEKAIAERLINSLSEKLGKSITVVNSPDEENTQLISLYVKLDNFTVRMDTSGVHLHKRGYGINKEDAPLRETLACALLYTIGWNQKVFHLADPMCGSGTIPIEAALMAKQMPWSELRDFAFQKWKVFQTEIYEITRSELKASINNSTNVFIHASDIDEKAIRSANTNAVKSNTESLINFDTISINDIKLDKRYCILTNPPWGKRLEFSSLHTIWKELHSLAVKGNQVFILLPELSEKDLKHNFKTLLRFYSGGIKIKLIKLEA